MSILGKRVSLSIQTLYEHFGERLKCGNYIQRTVDGDNTYFDLRTDAQGIVCCDGEEVLVNSITGNHICCLNDSGEDNAVFELTKEEFGIATFEHHRELTEKETLDAVYDLNANQHLGLAVRIKEDPEWCKEHLGDFTPLVKTALEKVLCMRQSERPAVYEYYFKDKTWRVLHNNHELQVAYEILKVGEDNPNVPAEKLISIKRAIRTYHKQPAGPTMVRNEGESVTTVERLPVPDSWDKEQAEGWFYDHCYRPIIPSPYDCTGQIFTTWYKVFRRSGAWWAYHTTSMDV